MPFAHIDLDNVLAIGERRRRWLEATTELSEALEPPIRIEEAVRHIIDSAQRVAGCDVAAVVSHDGTAVSVVAACGVVTDAILTGLAQALAGRADDESSPVAFTEGELSFVSQPLEAHLVGPAALVLVRESTSPWSTEDLELLVTFVEHASLGLDRVQALADREVLAGVRDRERVARDLHDVVMQRLFATGLQLQGLSASGVTGEVKASIDQAVDALDDTVREIRRAVFDLRAPGGD